MKQLFAALPLAFALCTGTLSAQMLDQNLCSRFDAGTVRSLYPIVRSTTISTAQQTSLAELLQSENDRFVQLLAQDGGILTPASEAELTTLRDASLRKVLSEEQLLQYFRSQVASEARARGKAVQKNVAKQLELSYMELKYIDNTFFKIEQDVLAAKLLYKNAPQKAAAEAERIRTFEIAELEKKSGIQVDQNLKATRVTVLTDYAPVLE